MSFCRLLDCVGLKASQMRDYRDALGSAPSVQIFGAGENGRSVRQFLETSGYSVCQFIDNDAVKVGSLLDGLPVVAPAELGAGVPIVIASSWGRDIALQLRSLGRTDHLDFSFCFDSMYRSHFDLDPLREAAEVLIAFHDALEDENSRAVWVGLLRYRLTLDPVHVVTSAYPQYFCPQVPILPGDVVVDGGAWIGDTAQAFLDTVDGQCRVIAFEPASANFQRLTEELTSAIAADRILPVNKGLWDRATQFRINTSFENSGRSKVEDNGTDVIELVRLDDWLDPQQHVSVIKFDLEGAEQPALRGAMDTLCRHRPRLMLSIYHHGNDFWEIFRQLRAIHPDYRFRLGHHSASMFETVLYAY